MLVQTRALIYGTGGLYKDVNHLIKQHYDIIGLMESNPSSAQIDGFSVYHPNQTSTLEYDLIIVLSSFVSEIRQQLIAVGVDESVIKQLDDLPHIIDAAKREFSEHFTSTEYHSAVDHTPSTPYVPSIRVVINSLGGGGAEKSLVTLLEHIPADTATMTLLVLFSGDTYKASIPDHVQLIDVEQQYANQNILRLVLRHATSNELATWFNAHLFDLDIAYLEGWASKVVASSGCNRRIAWCHTNLATNHWTLNYCFSSTSDEAQCYLSFEHIVFVSQDGLTSFKQLYECPHDRLIVIPNLLSAASNSNHKFRAPYDNNFTFFSVGRLVEVKGYDRLVKGFAKFVKSGRYARLNLIGEGPERKNLLALIDKLGLSEQIILSGFQKSPFSYAQDFHCFISSSYTEGHSLAVAEALLNRFPVLATRCGGNAEILENGKCGLLVDNSTEGLVSGMISVFDHMDTLETLTQRSSESKVFSSNSQTLLAIKNVLFSNTINNSKQLEQSCVELVSSQRKLILWGANGLSRYLYEICKIHNIDTTVVDKTPSARQALFNQTAIQELTYLKNGLFQSVLIVNCADEQRYGSQIRQQAKELGNFEVISLADFKRAILNYKIMSFIDLTSIAIPTPAVTVDKYLITIPRFAMGGAENQALLLAESLLNQGYQVTLLSLTHSKNNCPKFVERMNEKHIPHHSLPDINSAREHWEESQDKIFGTSLYFELSPNGFHYLIELSHYIAESGHNKLIAFLDDANIIGGLTSLIHSKLQTLLLMRSLSPVQLISQSGAAKLVLPIDKMKATYRKLLNNKRIIAAANSKQGMNSYLNWLNLKKDSIKYLPNAIRMNPSTELEPIRVKFEIAENTPLLLGVMRLEKEKGPDEFIKVVKRLKDTKTHFHTLLVGDGSMRETLHQFAKDSGLDDVLTFVGEVNDPRSFYESSDVVLQTSRIEGLPNVIIEAQAQKCLIVATDSGSTKDAMSPNYHHNIIEIDNTVALSEAVNRCLTSSEDARLKNCEEAYQYVQQHFSTSALVTSTLQFLEVP